MIKVFIYSCLLLVFLINCKSNIPEARNKTDYSQITHYSSRSAHPISSVNFDTIRIDAGNENEMTSLLGSFLFLGDTLCFADREQSTLFLYDRDGRFLGTHLSYGRGPQEIQGIYEITALPQGGYAIINDWHLNIFDQSWGGKQQLRIDWQNDKTPEILLASPGPDESGIYEIEHFTGRLCPLGNYLAIAIVTDCITYNGFRSNSQAAHFYENSYTLGLIDPRTGKVERMMCTHSPIYKQYRYIPNFKSILFDTDTENTLFYSFQIDSLIHQTDFKNNTLQSFGLAGHPMNTDYRETNTFEEATNNYKEDYKKFGSYRYLKYIPETKVLFRNFYHGEPSCGETVQAYKNQTLVAEFNVPDNFRIFGYSAPYYYAYGKPDLDTENMIIYKFKLEI